MNGLISTELGKIDSLKEELKKERKILMKSMANLLVIKLESSQVDVLNVEFLFVKYIVH